MSGMVAPEGGLVLILSVGRSVRVGSSSDGGFSSDDRFLNGRIRWVGSPAAGLREWLLGTSQSGARGAF